MPCLRLHPFRGHHLLRLQPVQDGIDGSLRKCKLRLAFQAADDLQPIPPATLWGGRRYGLEIIRSLESQSQLALAEGTIYPILNRLKAEEMVTSEWVEAEAGHPRKYYSLTEQGRNRLRQMAEAWAGFSAGMNNLLEPVLAEQETVK